MTDSNMTNGFRREVDSLGPLAVPAGAYWGVQTQRAVENFPISGLRLPHPFITALGMLKAAAAQANMDLGLLDPVIGNAILRAAEEVAGGAWFEQFPLDVFQTGSGTSTNMNANEVIANRANELLGFPLGSKQPVHANDHVNMGQSSNDIFPTCIHVSAARLLTDELLPVLRHFQEELAQKAEHFMPIIKLGRTHLQDATPIRLGQEFRGFATMVGHDIRRIEDSLDYLLELAVGGTAVGTGINTHWDFPRRVVEKINRVTGLTFREAEDHFEAQGSRDALVHAGAALKTLAVSLIKIANDVRWLGSGPYGGIGELILPAVQPGSSIMPGKVNPVMTEALIQVAAQVIGCDAANTVAGLSGNFQLNVMMPLLAHNVLFSIGILKNGVALFTTKCIAGLNADEARCRSLLDRSLAMVTALAPVIGYDRAAKIAHEAHQTGKSLKEIVLAEKLLSEAQYNRLMDPATMTVPLAAQ